MPKPRLAYAANRQIGLNILRILLASDWEPVVLVLAKGKAATFDESMRELLPRTPVLAGKIFRESEGIALLRELDIDYFLSVHFPYIIPPTVLELPSVGCLNLHPAYLPYNRGWHTPTWAILDGTPYGATLHWIDEGIDTGDIARQRQVDVRPDDTAHTLYQRVLSVEEELFREAVPQMMSCTLPRIPQDTIGTVHNKNDLASIRKLDFENRPYIQEAITLLRALTTNHDSEAAYFETDGVRYSVQIEIKRLDDET